MTQLKKWDRDFENLMKRHEQGAGSIHHVVVSADYAFKLLSEFVELFPGIPGIKKEFLQWKDEAHRQGFI